MEERLKRELERALEEKPSKGNLDTQGDSDRNNSFVEDEGELHSDEGEDVEEEEDDDNEGNEMV